MLDNNTRSDALHTDLINREVVDFAEVKAAVCADAGLPTSLPFPQVVAYAETLAARSRESWVHVTRENGYSATEVERAEAHYARRGAAARLATAYWATIEPELECYA